MFVCQGFCRKSSVLQHLIFTIKFFSETSCRLAALYINVWDRQRAAGPPPYKFFGCLRGFFRGRLGPYNAKLLHCQLLKI
jgi:hypothetical protein